MASIITAGLTSILTPIMGFIIWQLQRIITAKECECNGIKTLLKAVMKEHHKEYTNKGTITADELAEFKELYEAYHNLKGNGRGTIWMEDIEKLERKED